MWKGKVCGLVGGNVHGKVQVLKGNNNRMLRNKVGSGGCSGKGCWDKIWLCKMVFLQVKTRRENNVPFDQFDTHIELVFQLGVANRL